MGSRLSPGILSASLACVYAHYHRGSHTPGFLVLVLWERVLGGLNKEERQVDGAEFSCPSRERHADSGGSTAPLSPFWHSLLSL